MRLAVVSPFLDRHHGTEICLIEQIERLAEQSSWQIHLYSQRVSDVRGLSSTRSAQYDSSGGILWHQVSGIPGPHVLQYLWWFLANQRRRERDRRSGRNVADLTYSPGINCWDADVIAVHIVFSEFYQRVRSELSLRRTPFRNWPRAIHRRLYYKLIRALERRIYRNPSVQLVAVSSLVSLQLKNHFGRADACVIPNGVDSKRFTAEARRRCRDESRKLLQFAAEEFVVLLIGNDWKKKGLDTLLRAATLLRNPKLRILVVGSDDPGLYGAMLQQMGLQNDVRFEKPKPDVLSFYAAADLYAAPSLEDAFNLPILEAMACGLPVIGSVEAGASENIREGQTGLLLRNPQDPQELAGLLGRVLEDPGLGSRLGQAAAQHVRANCGWEENAERTRELLETVLRKRQKI